MHKQRLLNVRRIFLTSGLLAVLIVTLVGTGSVAAHGNAAAKDNLCYRLRVGLSGNTVTSRECLLKDKPAAGSVSPYSIQPGSCTTTDVQLFEDNAYGAAELCFWLSGTIGTANLTDYQVNIFINWNDRVTSYKTGNYDMTFSWDINGGGERYSARDHTLCPWIGSHWNDRASWIQLTNGSGNPQEFC